MTVILRRYVIFIFCIQLSNTHLRGPGIQLIDETVSTKADRLLTLSSRLLSAYFTHRTDGSRKTTLWRTLLRSTAQHPENLTTSLPALLDIAASFTDTAKGILTAEANELDGVIQHLMLDGGDYALLKRLLQNPGRSHVDFCGGTTLTAFGRSFHFSPVFHWRTLNHLAHLLCERRGQIAFSHICCAD